jgi:hypothetical protein
LNAERINLLFREASQGSKLALPQFWEQFLKRKMLTGVLRYVSFFLRKRDAIRGTRRQLTRGAGGVAKLGEDKEWFSLPFSEP